MGNIGKIYSRKRFVVGFNIGSKTGSKIGNEIGSKTDSRVGSEIESKTGKNTVNIGNQYSNGFSGKYEKEKNKSKIQIIKLIITLIIILLLVQMMIRYMEPVFEEMCNEKIKTLAILITNQQSTIVMNKYQYDELYTVERDTNGNIKIIRSNVVPINNMISDLTKNIQKEFEKIGKQKIIIPLGSMSGIYFLSGSGPEISFLVSVTGTVDTEIKSEFIAQGINQTLHRVYVNFECHMKIITPLKNYTQEVTNQVILAEHVIVGNIPDGYYNLEGIESNMDALNIIE